LTRSSTEQSLGTASHHTRLWLLLGLLLLLRVPSIVQPAGGDQGLYAYEGQRILAGDVLYRDAWDQKPPAIAFLYAALVGVWPRESVVAVADLLAAAGVAALLVAIGRRRFSAGIGFAAASAFLLFGDPYLQRLSGIYVRGQCEPFIALAVTAAVALLAGSPRRRRHLVVAGMALADAFWLKYNAVTYLIPAVAAIWAWRPERDADARPVLQELAWIAAGFTIVSAAFLGYFAAHGALHDLRLATIDYNLRYSDETYASAASVLVYPFTLPIERARVDMLWFLGGLGSLLLAWQAFIQPHRGAVVPLAWIAAAILSIAINGQRNLPNYFVQAYPALALAAASGLAGMRLRPAWVRWAVGLAFVAAVWRVGADAPVAGLRWGGLPGLVANIEYDLSYARGQIDRATYLSRFRGVKHDALEVDNLARDVREKTQPNDRVFVFGFSGGSVSWKAERQSASRFFWSRPVLIEFAASEPGYGSAGLLADLQRHPPVVVALQKEQWLSATYFLNNAPLRAWLESGYVLDRETPMFSVLRRKP